jgi:hypothetical protein
MTQSVISIKGASEHNLKNYARIGVPYSPATGLPIESQTISHLIPPPEAVVLHGPIAKKFIAPYSFKHPSPSGVIDVPVI